MVMKGTAAMEGMVSPDVEGVPVARVAQPLQGGVEELAEMVAVLVDCLHRIDSRRIGSPWTYLKEIGQIEQRLALQLLFE